LTGFSAASYPKCSGVSIVARRTALPSSTVLMISSASIAEVMA
jgi:hypothetical protein